MSATFNALHLQAAVLDVLAAGRAPRTLLMQRQRQRLARLMDAARHGSRFWRQRLGKAEASLNGLRHVPPIQRGELMAHFDEAVTDPALKLDELHDFLADPALVGQSWQDRYVLWESSGTSGQPGVFVQDAQAMAVYDALELVRHRVALRAPGRLLGPWLNPFAAMEALGAADRSALVVATGGHFASVVSFERLRRINPWLASQAQSFSLMQPLADLVRQLNRFEPSVLATYPTAAAMLADEAEAGRLHIRPRSLMLGGEVLSPAVRERLARVFGASVRNGYGASEFLPLAWECAHGQLHLNEDWALLEPVDEHHRPVPPDQASHTVLLTNLANLSQPLIRYDLGDQITWHGRRCDCGSPLTTLAVGGRRDDVLHVPAQRKGDTVSLLPLALSTVIEQDCGLYDYQLQQRDARTLVLRLPLQGPAADAAIKRCRQALQQFATAQGAAPIRVLGEPGCPTPRGRSGKACRVAWSAA